MWPVISACVCVCVNLSLCACVCLVVCVCACMSVNLKTYIGVNVNDCVCACVCVFPWTSACTDVICMRISCDWACSTSAPSIRPFFIFLASWPACVCVCAICVFRTPCAHCHQPVIVSLLPISPRFILFVRGPGCWLSRRSLREGAVRAQSCQACAGALEKVPV